MAGKRPDQHNIDPSEGGATDYKNLPQTGRGNSDSLSVDGDKHHLAQNVGSGGGSGQHFFDPKHPQPSQHANAGQPENEGEEGRSDEELRELRGTEDPRDRGVGA